MRLELGIFNIIIIFVVKQILYCMINYNTLVLKHCTKEKRTLVLSNVRKMFFCTMSHLLYFINCFVIITLNNNYNLCLYYIFISNFYFMVTGGQNDDVQIYNRVYKMFENLKLHSRLLVFM